MKSFVLRFVLVAIAVACLSVTVSAQQSPYGSTSLLPLPKTGYQYQVPPKQQAAPSDPRRDGTNYLQPRPQYQQAGPQYRQPRPQSAPYGNSYANNPYLNQGPQGVTGPMPIRQPVRPQYRPAPQQYRPPPQQFQPASQQFRRPAPQQPWQATPVSTQYRNVAGSSTRPLPSVMNQQQGNPNWCAYPNTAPQNTTSQSFETLPPQNAPQQYKTNSPGGWNTYPTNSTQPLATPEALPRRGQQIYPRGQFNGYGNSYGYGYGNNSYANPYGQYGSYNGDTWGGAGCSTCGQVDCCCPSPWFGRLGTLVMTRDTENAEYFSYFDNNEANQLMDSRDLLTWGGGFEAMIGKCMCGGWSWQASYFGVIPSEQEANLYDPAGATSLNTTLDINPAVQYDDGGGLAAIVGWFDGALRHRLRRSYEIHNVEFNIFHGNGYCGGGSCGSGCGGGYGGGYGYGDGYRGGYNGYGYGGYDSYGNGSCGDGCCEPEPCCGPCMRFQWLVGLRYFRFSDHFDFYSDDTDTNFTGAPNEVYYGVWTENNLLGFQFGGEGEYYCTNRLSFLFGTKLGMYANHISHHSFLGGSAGSAVITSGPNTGQRWDINSSGDDIAFLGEFNFGAGYQLSCRWSAVLGYRVMFASGVALSTNQIPRDFRGVQDVSKIDTNGSLFLHGGYAALEYNY